MCSTRMRPSLKRDQRDTRYILQQMNFSLACGESVAAAQVCTLTECVLSYKLRAPYEESTAEREREKESVNDSVVEQTSKSADVNRFFFYRRNHVGLRNVEVC